MNAYNQRRNENPHSQTFTRYKEDDDSFTLLVKKYASNVENKIVDILKKDKNFKEENAKSFMKNLFSIDKKRSLDQRKEIQNCYVKGKTVKKCAEELLDKYYKMTTVNKYQNTQKFQTDRNLAGEGEVTEVTENKRNINNKYNIYHNLALFSEFVANEDVKKGVNESVDYNKFKKVSPSLFYNFLSKVGKLGIKFKLDTTYVKGVKNSFNNKPYVLYVETPEINDNQIKNVFKYNKILSKFLQYLDKDKYDSNSGFYIGIDNNSYIHFGLITNNMKYKVGYTKYTSNEFKKIIPHIQSDKQIELEKLSKKIVSTLYSIGNANKVFDLHLNKYGEDIDSYISIIDDKFNIVIETLDDDIITLNYIENMVKDYVKVSRHNEWELKKEKKSNKTVYYFTLK